MQDNKNGSYNNINCIRKTWENVDSLLNEEGDLLTKDLENAEILSAFFISVFTGKTVLQVKGGNFPSLFCSFETTSGVMFPVLGSPVQERYGLIGTSSAKGHKDQFLVLCNTTSTFL